MKKLMSCILCLITLLASLSLSKESIATPPSRKALLLLTTEERVNSKTTAISLLKSNKEIIIKAITDYAPTLSINLPQKPSKWQESYVEINQIEFLFENASVEKIKRDDAGKVIIPGEGSLFKIMAPIVLKGSSYKEVKGKIIVRVDKHIKEQSVIKDKEGRVVSEREFAEDIPVFATMIIFFVDEKGNIYY